MFQEKEKKNYVNIGVRPKTKELLLDNCIKEFLFHNPQFKGMRISQDFILGKIIEDYLRDGEYEP